MLIESARLTLVPAHVTQLRAELEGREAFAKTVEAQVPVEWPPDKEYDAEAIRYGIEMQQENPEAYEWGLRYLVLKGAAPRLVGCGGYTTPPKDGAVEIGYSVCPSDRRRGYASEAAAALIARAFARADVAQVIAHTFPAFTSSIGVMEKCGMRFVGAGQQADTVCYAITRTQWRSAA